MSTFGGSDQKGHSGQFYLCVVVQAGKMIVSITGATGFVGKRLVQKLLADNHSVRVMTRSRANALLVFPVEEFPQVIVVEEAEWKESIQASTAVVNLAGRPISTAWTPQVKKEIRDSRINTTLKVVEFINSSPAGLRPKVLISGSACGFYGPSETTTFDGKSPAGKDFLSEVCQEWEAAARRVNTDVRLVIIRTGVVFGKEGGALAKMIPAFKMYAGGRMGSGKQWLPWIHVDDHVNLVYTALCNPSYKGAFNAAAPNPVQSEELSSILGSVLGRPSWLPMPEFFLRFVLKEGACVVLEGQRAVPSRALELGYSFKYTNAKDAVSEICLGKLRAPEVKISVGHSFC